MKLPLKELFYEFRDTESVGNSWPQVHHVIDQGNLSDDRFSAGALHQSLDVTYSQTNEEVHEDDGEQNDVGSKEKVGSSCKTIYSLHPILKVITILTWKLKIILLRFWHSNILVLYTILLLCEVDKGALRKQLGSIIQFPQHHDHHSDQGNGEGFPLKNSVVREEDFECDKKSNRKPDVTEEEFTHFETNRSRIKEKWRALEQCI